MRKDEFPIVDKFVKDSINEVLDKIRAEIEKKHARSKQMSSVLQMNAYTDCLQIIDKFKAESEGKNEAN